MTISELLQILIPLLTILASGLVSYQTTKVTARSQLKNQYDSLLKNEELEVYVLILNNIKNIKVSLEFLISRYEEYIFYLDDQIERMDELSQDLRAIRKLIFTIERHSDFFEEAEIITIVNKINELIESVKYMSEPDSDFKKVSLNLETQLSILNSINDLVISKKVTLNKKMLKGK